ncbi:dopamine N-acetyltransferase-like isoform X2 [Thrips palmi]|uniref:aralkylamine N-acetyltransferase n=1 Tax=Thrips palmi TaxID=161013 RepID=A0A6P8YMV2_THRPL|nr:dopamine N-acetyltransferase-like isoform X2 [Thrips palmi]
MALQFDAMPAEASVFRFPDIRSSLPAIPVAAAADKRTFEIVRLVQKDKPKVLEFLRKFFYHDEPLNTAIGLRPDVRCPTLEEFSLSTFDEGISVGAVAGDGSLVGVCINATLTREEDEENRRECEEGADDVPEDVKALEDPDAKFAQIKRMLSHATAQGDVFGHGPPGLDRLFDIFILSVDSSWRGKGIATKLLDESREIAQADGHRLIRIVCSSFVSALIASRMGYRCIAKLDYKTVLDRKGQRIFPTEPPHDAVTTYVLDI